MHLLMLFRVDHSLAYTFAYSWHTQSLLVHRDLQNRWYPCFSPGFQLGFCLPSSLDTALVSKSHMFFIFILSMIQAQKGNFSPFLFLKPFKNLYYHKIDSSLVK